MKTMLSARQRFSLTRSKNLDPECKIACFHSGRIPICLIIKNRTYHHDGTVTFFGDTKARGHPKQPALVTFSLAEKTGWIDYL